MNKNFCVYKITNILNNKVYIGKTNANTNRRWADHVREASSEKDKKCYIHRAINKYGIDNFIFEIIKYYSTEDAAFNGEIKYIKKYNAFGEGGYNETRGGKISGKYNRKLTDNEVKFLIRDYIYKDLTCLDLSKKYNLAKPSVLDILNRRNYIDIKISDNIRYQVWLKLHRNYYEDKTVWINSSFRILTDNQIKSIFFDYSSGNFTFSMLAEKYNTCNGNIDFILNRKTHKSITINKKIFNKVNTILEGKIKINPKYKSKNERYYYKQEIFKDFKNGLTKNEISEKYKINKDIIIKILNGTYWMNILLDEEFKQYVQPKITQLSEDVAQSIIDDYCSDMSIYDLIKKYSIERNKIKNILQRKSFNTLKINIDEKLFFEKVKNDFPYKLIKDESIIPLIFNRYLELKNMNELSKEFNIKISCISNILYRKTYKYIYIDLKIEEKIKEILKNKK